jgi:hypothetical protein
MIGKFLSDVKYLRGSPKRALSFETEARDHLASWLVLTPPFFVKKIPFLSSG